MLISDEIPVVSIYVLTYNHEKYIAQALDSILMQKVNFKYEVIVGEDCSTDNTRNILLKYYEENPDKFKLILQKSNVGAVQNIRDVFNECKGKYIAALEGDDYWTDEHKLQKQVDFLEANPDFAAVGHQTIVKVENEQKINEKLYINETTGEILFFKGKKTIIKFKDIILSPHIHINSILYKSSVTRKYYCKDIFLYDHPFLLLVASEGKIKILPEKMSVYRRHSTGASANINHAKAYEVQKKWVTDVYNILGCKFFLGYHYQISEINCNYALNHPNETNLGKQDLTYNYIKNIFLTLILFPRNIKSLLRKFVIVLKRLTKN